MVLFLLFSSGCYLKAGGKISGEGSLSLACGVWYYMHISDWCKIYMKKEYLVSQLFRCFSLWLSHKKTWFILKAEPIPFLQIKRGYRVASRAGAALQEWPRRAAEGLALPHRPLCASPARGRALAGPKARRAGLWHSRSSFEGSFWATADGQDRDRHNERLWDEEDLVRANTSPDKLRLHRNWLRNK